VTQEHRYREHWINVAFVAKAEYGTRPYTLLLTFDNPAVCAEAMESLCTGRELRGGGILHDEGKHCPVHAR
jgi:hypothetical protein